MDMLSCNVNIVVIFLRQFHLTLKMMAFWICFALLVD